VKISC